MVLSVEQVLARIFADAAPRRFGTGWISGTLAVLLGVLSLAAVLCLHFPQWLTIPELRARYPLGLVRTAVDLSILAVLGLSALSLVLRRKKALGIAGLALAAATLRKEGIDDVASVRCACMEADGEISVLANTKGNESVASARSSPFRSD